MIEMLGQNTVALHVRRTDYATYKGGKLLCLKYYLQAISILKQKRGKDMQILVFSDDVEFCKKNLPSDLNLKYVSDMTKLSDIEEFYLMSKCRDFIMANSSFSWWASYLGNAPDKIVIAPVVDQWKKDFYLPEWISIPTHLEQESD